MPPKAKVFYTINTISASDLPHFFIFDTNLVSKVGAATVADRLKNLSFCLLTDLYRMFARWPDNENVAPKSLATIRTRRFYISEQMLRYRSSRKYVRPSEAGGCDSLRLTILVTTSTTTVTRYGTILIAAACAGILLSPT